MNFVAVDAAKGDHELVVGLAVAERRGSFVVNG
jgi:hypothetical protein